MAYSYYHNRSQKRVLERATDVPKLVLYSDSDWANCREINNPNNGKKRNKNFPRTCVFNWKGTCNNNCPNLHEPPESRSGVCYKYQIGICTNILDKDHVKFGLKKGTYITCFPMNPMRKESQYAQKVRSNVVTGDNDSPGDTYDSPDDTL